MKMKYKLEEFCEFITDGTHQTPEYCEDGGVKFLSSKDVTARKIDWDNVKHIPESLHEKLYARLSPRKNDILLAKNGTTGVAALVDRDEIFDVYVSLAVLRPKNIVYPKYLLYAINSPVAKRQFDAGLKGVGVPNLHLSVIRKTEINIEEYEKQLEVCEILDKVASIIDARKEELQKLDDLIKARFVELFGDPMTNSNNYVLKKYGDRFELNAGGTPSKQKSEYWDNGTISWIGSNMCQNTVIYENDGNYITDEGLKHSSARMFPVDTVLIALVGATIGKTALLKFETTTNQNVLGIRGVRESGYTPEFIFYYTQGLYQKFLNIGDGGFAMASKGFISELPVPVVDLSLQEQFSAFVEQIDKSKVAVQKALDEAQLLFDSLMQKYFG